MSRKFILDDGIEYLPDSGELKSASGVENLQSLENKLLLHFVTHPDQLVSKETLYQVGWQGRIYGDNPLSKAISNLRSKLGDSSRAPRFIKTIPKKGFRFIAPVALQQQQAKPILAPGDQVNEEQTIRLPVLMAFAVVIALSMMLWLGLNPGNDKLMISQEQLLDKVKQLTHQTGVEKDPHLSTDGQWVAFTRQLNDQSRSQIIIKSVNGDREITINQGDFNHFTPKWHSDGRRLLYHRFGPQGCQIAMLQFDRRMQVVSDQILVQCGDYSDSIGLSWGPPGSIYYTDIDLEFAPLNIYQLDLDSGHRSLLTSPNEQGRGYYRLEYDEQTERLYALLSVDWYATKITILNQQGQIIDQHQENLPLFAISAFNGGPVFKTEGNHIHNWTDNGHVRLMQSPLEPVFAPQFNNGQQPAMVFIRGAFLSYDLVEVDLDTGKQTTRVTGEARNRLPVMTDSGNLYFISNRSGVLQVWRQKDGALRQLSHFSSDLRIDEMALSPDENFIALTIDNNIQVYPLQNQAIMLEQPYVRLEQAINPHFSMDSQQLWFSNKQGEGYQLTAIDVADKTRLNVRINHAYLGMFDRHTGTHYAFKYDQPGIWTVNGDKLQWLSEAPLMNSIHSAAIHQGILTWYSDNEGKVMQMDLKKQVVTELLATPDRFFSLIRSNARHLIVSRKKFGNTHIFLAEY